MKKTLKPVFLLLLVASIVLCSFVQVSAVTGKVVNLSFDSTDANVNEIITASISVGDIPGFAGMQFHMHYDPAVLQAIDPVTGVPYPANINSLLYGYTNALRGDILSNSQYNPFEWAAFDSVNGTVDATKLYFDTTQYRTSGIDESTGTVFRIGFKILQKQATTVYMQNSPTIPSAIDGTLVADWYGMITDYQVQQTGNVINEGY